MFKWLRNCFRRGPVVPVVRLSGVIATGGLLGSRGLSIELVAPLLARAFAQRGAKAVALVINSPGGSPVQSALIGQAHPPAGRREEAAGDRLRRGCRGFGRLLAGLRRRRNHRRRRLDRRLDRRGLCRIRLPGPDRASSASSGACIPRARTSRCSIPFATEKPEDVERLKRLQAEIHDGFKDWVRERRGTQAQGRRLAALHRRVLDRHARARAGAGRQPGRAARRAAGALRRQGASAGRRRAAEFLSRFGLGSGIETDRARRPSPRWKNAPTGNASDYRNRPAMNLRTPVHPRRPRRRSRLVRRARHPLPRHRL